MNAARWGFASLKTVLLALVLLAPATASAWWNHDWAYRKPLTLDASPKGADVKETVTQLPVLVRLHDGVLKFADVSADGADLRFIDADDKTPLKYHVEKFDSVFNLAFVWVSVPKLEAGKPTTIWMYYGNPKAVSGSEPRATYDPDQILALHFGERGTPAQDATGYANNAQSAAGVDQSALIGSAAKFDGSLGVALPASASLAIAAGATRTWTLWFKPNAVGDAVLFTQRDGSAANGITLGLAGGAPYINVAGRQTGTSTPLGVNDWHHLAVVADGATTTLYVDGIASGTLPGALPALSGASVIGAATAQGGAAAQGFNGVIDELGIAKVARSAAYVEALAKNEGTADKLASFGADEGLSSFSTGYFGIILQSVTFDAWVVIGVLFLLAVLSWVVMVSKTRYTGRVHQANELFSAQFETIRSDVTNFEGSRPLSEAERKLLRHSTLYRMYDVGRKGISKRFENQGQVHVLSVESIEAIRASVDAAQVREKQRLDKGLVALTIAISGGPFIGLLGTVVGVMITFASIAAAGEVNVNAIAPGISAALLATVAGMAVAIPALFGYNFLLGRIKDIQANMTVFVDEFVTLMAEAYPASGSDHGHGVKAAVGHH